MVTSLSRSMKVFTFSCLSVMSIACATHEVTGYMLDRRDGAQLQAVIREALPSGPVMVDDYLRLDGVRAGAHGRQVIYSLTLLSAVSTEVTREQFREIARGVYARGREDGRLRSLFAAGFSVRYEYVGRDGLAIGQVDLTPSDMLR